MEIIIANKYHYNIQNVFQEPLRVYTGEVTVQEVESILTELYKLRPQTLIIDTSIHSIENNLTFSLCEKVRLHSPRTRIIVVHRLTKDEEKGNGDILSPLINLGVYDLVVDTEDSIEDEFIERELTHVIDNPKSWNDVFRYHNYNAIPQLQPKIQKEKEIVLKEKVVVKKEIETVIKDRPVYINNNNIGFINLSNRSGSTFLSSNLALLLSNVIDNVFYIETPKEDNIYFYHLYENPNTKELCHHQNLDFSKPCFKKGKLNLIINTLQKHITYDNYWISMLNTNTTTVFDLGDSYLTSEDTYNHLKFMDKVFVVVDPSPLQFSKYSSNLAKLKPFENNIHFIITRKNKNVDVKELKQTLLEIYPNSQVSFISEIPFEIIMSAENTNRFVSELKVENAEKFKSECHSIMESFLPKEILSPKKKFNLFKRKKA